MVLPWPGSLVTFPSDSSSSSSAVNTLFINFSGVGPPRVNPWAVAFHNIYISTIFLVHLMSLVSFNAFYLQMTLVFFVPITTSISL